MEINQFIKKIAEQFDDTDLNEFNSETRFKELEEWSSLITLAILNMVKKEYNVSLKFEDIKQAETIQELFEIVNTKSE